MKKLCLLICILLLACAVVPSVAMAETAAQKHISFVDVNMGSHGYRASSIFSDGKSIGMRFYGYYFGNSDIPVTFEIYSDANYDFDFYLGDRDYAEGAGENQSGVAMLTEKQTETKHFVLDLFAQADAFITEIDRLVNTQIEGSDIYNYNNAAQGEKIQISEHTFRILQLAREMYDYTDHTFNPAVYRLVDLWGFSSRIFSNGNFGLPYDRAVSSEVFWKQGYPLPDEKYIKAFSQPDFTDYSENAVVLTQDGDKFYVTKNVAPAVVDGVEYGQWLDLGGIAKGYVVDYLEQLAEKNNIRRYYVDAGSSSSAYGLSFDGGTFSVGLQNPYSLFTSLVGMEIENRVVSTSGQYIRKYTVDGVEYSHIINGATGAPAQTGLKSVFVSIPNGSMWASKGDCLTTALTVMGRDGLVNFVNSKLKMDGISLFAVYETMSGKREILSNMDIADFTYKHENFSEFAWALEKDENGAFFYNEKATFTVEVNAYKVTIIVLAVIVGVALVGVVVYHFVKGKNSLSNVQCARKDKPFKAPDIIPYLAVVLLITALFAWVFGSEKGGWNTLTVADVETGETLFVFNAARNEYNINTENSRGWKVSVENTKNGIAVTFARDFDGVERFNKIEITQSVQPSVKMADSLCGFHQDCVHTFGDVDKAGGVIVCSPNRLKVLTE